MSWAATTASHSGDIVRDVVLAAVENRFGDELHKPSEIEWLSENGELHGRRHAPVRGGHWPEAIDRTGSPQSNGMAERFVKTTKCNYVAFMPKPDAATTACNVAIAFEHRHEKHPHSTLKYRSPRESRRSMDSVTLA